MLVRMPVTQWLPSSKVSRYQDTNLLIYTLKPIIYQFTGQIKCFQHGGLRLPHKHCCLSIVFLRECLPNQSTGNRRTVQA